ncbi:hypothetical protein Rhopal_005133-T1 [Rhodotorula paludigena]|uniref:Uncharacterized protein n=1 Tax=Rhodotorula paludigena TaxID=86838 RepID=A0AAV5GS98_9BASI|nr:hypothetical protein Rhopal_005133-T1 [Rhodotorula paludigena]
MRAAEVLDLTLSDSEGELSSEASDLFSSSLEQVPPRLAPAAASPGASTPAQPAHSHKEPSPARRSPAQVPRDARPPPSPPAPLPGPLKPADVRRDDGLASKRRRSHTPDTPRKKAAAALSPPATLSPRKNAPTSTARADQLAPPPSPSNAPNGVQQAETPVAALQTPAAGPKRVPVAAPALPPAPPSAPSTIAPAAPSHAISAAQPPPQHRPPPLSPAQRLSIQDPRGKQPPKRCRIPPKPPPLPDGPAVAIPFLLSRHPRLKLIAPHPAYGLVISPPTSPELNGSPAASTSRAVLPPASPPSPRHRLGLVETGPEWWGDLVPALVDQPHIGDDVAFTDEVENDRDWKKGFEPEALDIVSFPPDVRKRSLPPWVRTTTWRYKPLDDCLPDPYRFDEMRRADIEKARELAAEAAARAKKASAARARAAAAGSSGAGEVKDEDAMPPPPVPSRVKAPKKRRSRRHETEAELQARLRRLDDVYDLSASDSSEDDDAPTVGFRALALATVKEVRKKRKARVARGKSPNDSSGDEAAPG